MEAGRTMILQKYRKANKFAAAHYREIANILHSSMPAWDNTPVVFNKYAQWEDTCLSFLNRFRHDNPRFDSERFQAACRYGDGNKPKGR